MPLVGREPELAAIEDLLAHLGERGGSLLVRGEAGLGKSALLAEAASHAADRGLTVLTTAGVPSETQMAFAGLHRLLRRTSTGSRRSPARRRPPFARVRSERRRRTGPIPDRAGRARPARGGRGGRAAAADGGGRPLARRGHLRGAGLRRPAGGVRADRDPVRGPRRSPTRLDEAHLPELRLAPLDDADAARCSTPTPGGLAPTDRRRVLDAAGATRSRCSSCRTRRRRHRAPRRPSRRCRSRTRSSARSPSGCPRSPRPRAPRCSSRRRRWRQLRRDAAGRLCGAGRTRDRRPPRPAEATGLVQLGDAGVRFRHPLVRAAIYRSAPTPARQAAHAALADAHASDPDRSVWHRAASRSGPDAEVAARAR